MGLISGVCIPYEIQCRNYEDKLGRYLLGYNTSITEQTQAYLSIKKNRKNIYFFIYTYLFFSISKCTEINYSVNAQSIKLTLTGALYWFPIDKSRGIVIGPQGQ